MDHEEISDCLFKDHCAAFSDSLIGDNRKGPSGLGCWGQNDIYRSKHCRKFTCAYLSVVISHQMRQVGAVPDPPEA